MKLRGQLLLAAALIALLPLTAVLFLQPIERLLRAGHEQAVGEAAAAAAGLLQGSGVAPQSVPMDREGVLYLHPPRGDRLLDGYADDWRGSLDRVLLMDADGLTDGPASALDEGEAPVRLAAILDRSLLELFLQAADATPRYAAESGAPGDAVQLVLVDAEGERRFTLAPAAPGPLALRDRYGRLLRGYWQDRGDGWSVELRVPVSPPVTSLMLDVIDRGAEGQVENRLSSGTLSTFGRDPQVDARLAALGIGPAWWVGPDGWVRAQAAGPADVRQAAEDELAPRYGVLDFLMAARLEAASAWSERSARLEGSAIQAALAGERAAEWRRVGEDRAVRLRYAMPLEPGSALVLERDAGPLLLLANRAVLSWLGASLAVFMAVALVLFGFVLVLSLRIRRLRNAAEQAVGKGGRLEELPPASSAADELGDLSRSLRELLERLREHQRYLQTLADKLAHELRTPVSMVQSSLDNLAAEAHAGKVDGDRAEAYLKRAEQGTQRLRRIVQAMSQAARLEDSLRSEPRQAMDLAALLRDYVAARRDAHPDRTLSLSLAAGPEAGFEGAEDLLAQLLDKIVDNALDFAPADGRIELRLGRDGDDWCLEIENQGPPIEPAAQAAMFDSMVSFRTARSDAPHLGLGLYVARCIAEYHGGRIAARPSRDGTVIEVRLPVTDRESP